MSLFRGRLFAGALFAGTLWDGAQVVSPPADTFNYSAAFNPTLGRYTADPIISRIAQRQHLTRKRR